VRSYTIYNALPVHVVRKVMTLNIVILLTKSLVLYSKVKGDGCGFVQGSRRMCAVSGDW
jgi:hypothetical protein